MKVPLLAGFLTLLALHAISLRRGGQRRVMILQRGFIVTGGEKFLEPRKAARTKLHPVLLRKVAEFLPRK